jgi:hypothetical protein
MKIPKNMKIEPFAKFAEQGVPFLAMWTLPKTAHVEWLCDYGDGGMRRWGELLISYFNWDITHSTMNNELVDIWERYRPQLSYRAKLIYGGSTGCACYVPHTMAIEIHNIVREHYTRAMRMLVIANGSEKLKQGSRP